MSYQITGSFTLPLPDDYAEMGKALAEVTAAWQQFVGAHAAGDAAKLSLVQKRGKGAGNGAARQHRRGKPEQSEARQ